MASRKRKRKLPPPERRCRGHTKATGKRCENWTIVGGTVCSTHGGSAPQVKAAAKRRQDQAAALKAVALFSLRRDIGPHEALLELVQWTSGDVQLLREVVRGLEREAVVDGVTRTVQLPDGKERVEVSAAINVWVTLLERREKQLLDACKAAVACGVAERTVKIASEHAQQIAEKVAGILTDLGHDLKDKKTREVIRLRLIQGGQSDAA